MFCSLLDLDIIVVAVVRSWHLCYCCCIVSFICLAFLALGGLIFLVLFLVCSIFSFPLFVLNFVFLENMIF